MNNTLPAYGKYMYLKKPAETVWTRVANTTNVALSFTRNLEDNTPYNKPGFREKTPAIAEWSISCDLDFVPDDALITAMREALVNGTMLDMRYLPRGTDDSDVPILADGYQGKVYVESMNEKGSSTELLGFEVSFMGNGELKLPSN